MVGQALESLISQCFWYHSYKEFLGTNSKVTTHEGKKCKNDLYQNFKKCSVLKTLLRT